MLFAAEAWLSCAEFRKAALSQPAGYLQRFAVAFEAWHMRFRARKKANLEAAKRSMTLFLVTVRSAFNLCARERPRNLRPFADMGVVEALVGAVGQYHDSAQMMGLCGGFIEHICTLESGVLRRFKDGASRQSVALRKATLHGNAGAHLCALVARRTAAAGPARHGRRAAGPEE